MLMDAMIIRLEIQCELASVPNYSKVIRCVTSFASVEQKTMLLPRKKTRCSQYTTYVLVGGRRQFYATLLNAATVREVFVVQDVSS